MKFNVGDRVRYVHQEVEHRDYRDLTVGVVRGVTPIEGAYWPYDVEFDNYSYGQGYYHPCSEEELEHEV